MTLFVPQSYLVRTRFVPIGAKKEWFWGVFGDADLKKGTIS